MGVHTANGTPHFEEFSVSDPRFIEAGRWIDRRLQNAGYVQTAGSIAEFKRAAEAVWTHGNAGVGICTAVQSKGQTDSYH